MNTRTPSFRSALRSAIEDLERRVLLSASPVFTAPLTFGTGGLPQVAAVADFNSDGRADLAVTGLESNSAVGIMLGNGDGTFQAAKTFRGGVGAKSIAVADLNGDGRPDVVAPNTFDGTVSILLANGDGTLQAQSLVNTDLKISKVVVADLNRDGKLDLAVANVGATRVDVFIGNGDGTFGNIQFVNTGMPAISARMVDLNRDGKLDLVLASYDNGDVITLLGNGDGTFQAPLTFASDSSATALTTGDFNGDDIPDVAVTSNGNPGRVNVLTGIGDGSLMAPWTMAVANGYSRCVAAADLNGDGRPDLAVGGSAGALDVMLGNGNGTFETPRTFAATSNSFSVVPFDVNGDGLLDCVMPDISAGRVDVLLADPPPSVVSIIPSVNGITPIYTADSSLNYLVTFSEPVTGVDPSDFQVVTTGTVTASPLVAVAGGPTVYTVTVNGIAGGQSLANPNDLVTLGLNLVNDGSIVDATGQSLKTRSFVSFGAAKTFATPNGASKVTAADINGDGKFDIAFASYGSGTVSVALGNGDETFGALRTFAVGTHPFSVIAIDANRDGRADLVVSNQGSNNLGVLLGNGDGTFAPEVTFATGGSPWTVSAADVNRDGNPDLLVANKNSNSLSVLLGNGNGTFNPQLTFATGTGPQQIAVADFDGDGRIDVAAPNFSASTVSILLGNGDGNFHAAATLNMGAKESAVFAGDFNRDGKADLISGSNVLMGNGDGTFRPPSPATVNFVSDIGDMNNDGKLDLVGPWGGSAFVQLGNGDGTFAPPQAFGGPSTGTVTAADVDRNGYPDLLTTSGSVLLARADGSFSGKTVEVIPYLNVATYPAPYTSMTLMRNPDGLHIDAFTPRGFAMGQVLINDPAGMTITGNGQSDEIRAVYLNGNPFPQTLHLQGDFFMDAIYQGQAVTDANVPPTSFLAGTTLDIGRSTVKFYYTAAPNFYGVVQAGVKQGYNGSAWNGSPTDTLPSIVSSDAASGALGLYAVGFADTAHGLIPSGTSTYYELRFTVAGDTNLDGVVDSNDALILARHYPASGSPSWDLGNFNYDSATDYADALILQKNYNLSIASTSAVSGASTSGGTSTPIVQPSPVTATTPIPPTQPPTDQTPGSAPDSDGGPNDRTALSKSHKGKSGRKSDLTTLKKNGR